MKSDSDSDSISEDEIIEFDMAKYDLSTLHLKYSGNPEDDLDAFIVKFKNHAVLRDYTPDKSALALISKIDGHASIFLESIPDSDKDTVQKIHDLLKKYFEGDSWRWGVESKLLSRKQLINESLDTYASDIMRWCRQIKKPDSEQLSIFVRGLLPSLRGFVFSKQPKTFREALDAARLGLTVQNTASESVTSSCSAKPEKNHHESVSSLHATLDSITGVVSNLTSRLDKLEFDKSSQVNFPSNYGQRNDTAHQSNFRPRRAIVCYRCGRIGHEWRRCYAKHGVDGKPLN